MDYISVKAAAAKFGISERRVQKLCETNRIENCQMVSGVWIIPADAQKPVDERITEMPEMTDCMTLKEVCEELSISLATGKNWIKLGKIKPRYTEKKVPYFSREYVNEFKQDIQSGANNALKSRRNKKYITGNALYNSYVSEQCKSVEAIQQLLNVIAENKIELNEERLQILVADCAVKLFLQRYGIRDVKNETALLDFIGQKYSFGEKDRLILDLISNTNAIKAWIMQHNEVFQISYEYEEREDVLGLLYISCKNIGNRKATGSYYTPTKVVRRLIDKVVEKNGADKYVLDPCCGTGNFLLQLPEEFPLEKIYGNDIDDISVKITRLNMALRFKDADVEVICRNITNQNYLSEYKGGEFDLIIGNPPWGYAFGEEESRFLQKKYTSAIGKNIESYDVFIERALSQLKKGGVVSFVLPEAILNVKAHMPVRQIIADNSSVQYVEFLGNAFDKVQCPCLILQLKHTGEKISCIGTEVNDGVKTFQVKQEREIEPECFGFSMTDEEYQLITKIYSISDSVFLENNATFALGIVTGNNKEYISSTKTKTNEVILKGADICKYRMKETDNYIEFKPEKFQQIAPVAYYRAPEKLLYRFISSQLVFAYDDKQTLSLNSCNIVIPDIQGLDMKYILAVLNSRVAQFIYKKKYKSVKVLRSHIEQIPIPEISSEQQKKIIDTVNCLLVELPETETIQLYEKLDDMIRKLYGLSDREYRLLKESVDDENKFLV